MELIEKLGIDFQLLIAQGINFFILLFILSALVYKPILKLLDKRKKMIEKTVEDSQKLEERMEKLEVDRDKVLSEASEKAMAVIEKAKEEAEAEKQKIIDDAKKEVSALAERYRAQLQEEKGKMIEEVKAEVATLMVRGCEKIVRKEFGKDDQKRLEGAIKDELASTKL
jgi:F-type H+-transporting ATPase subunit b